MRIIVTGGAGFIGSHVVESLCAEGHDVIIVDNLSTGCERNIQGMPARRMRRQIQDLKAADFPDHIDAIVHLAAIPSVVQSWKIPLDAHDTNLTATLQVIEWAITMGCPRIVFASSAAVYGDDVAMPAAESDHHIPLSPYGVQKLASEHYLRCFSAGTGLTAVALRFFNVFGPRQSLDSEYAGVIAQFAHRALDGEPLIVHGSGEQTRDFVYVKDAALAVLRAIDVKMRPGEFTAINIGGGTETTINSVARYLIERCGDRSHLKHGQSRTGDIRRSCADMNHAHNYLGFQPAHTLMQGLTEYIEWLKTDLTELVAS